MPDDGLSEEDRKTMSLDELEKRKETNTERNAWAVAEEVRMRVDDEKGPGGDFMKAYLTEKLADQFFYNKDELLAYCYKTISQRSTIPGQGYFDKIMKFMDQHLEVGDLYMEYRKGECTERETLCDYCSRCPRGIQVEITAVP